MAVGVGVLVSVGLLVGEGVSVGSEVAEGVEVGIGAGGIGVLVGVEVFDAVGTAVACDTGVAAHPPIRIANNTSISDRITGLWRQGARVFHNC